MIAGAAQAQSAGAETPGGALRRQLTELAANPSSVAALVETGRAALAVGDGEAALGFFTRADQLASRDARVKAGLAAATARTGRAESALLLFAEAVALGAPEREIAAERGLAYDLLGQTARAQQDYVLSLRHREDPEVRRRLALSLAISGQRDAALRLVDEQIRQGDRAANRARVMVLALSGDVNGATAAARDSLPAHAAQAITPFLPRLASLSPGQMASAANLGRVPGGEGFRPASARGGAAADPTALAFAGGGGSGGGSGLSGRLPVAPVETAATRRRPGGVTEAARAPTQTARTIQPRAATPREAGRPRGSWTNASSTMASRQPTRVSEPATIVQPHPYEPLRLGGTRGDTAPAPPERIQLASAETSPAVPAAEPAADAVRSEEASAPIQQAAAQPRPEPTEPPPSEPPVDGAAANLAVWSTGAASAGSAPAQAPGSLPGFSDVVATVSALSNEPSAAAPASPRGGRSASRPPAASREAAAERSPARTERNRPAAAPARTAAAATRASARAATPREAHPPRIWVQLGVSQNPSAFAYDISRMRRAAPELLRNRTAYTAPIGRSQRLLVGPFPNEAAARTVVNGLKEKNISSLAWTSPAGTEVERFNAGR